MLLHYHKAKEIKTIPKLLRTTKKHLRNIDTLCVIVQKEGRRSGQISLLNKKDTPDTKNRMYQDNQATHHA